MISQKRHNKTKTGLVSLLMIVCFSLSLIGSVAAMPLHPEIRAEIAADPVLEAKYQADRARHLAAGVDSPGDIFEKRMAKVALGLSPAMASPFKVLVLLVDFSDNVAATNASYFDGLMFDSVGTSVRTYYSEVSYSQFDIVTVNLPSTTDWNRVPQLYSYYVNGEYGLGSYPTNAQKLTEDLVDIADASIDFSQYDNDGDGYVDALVIVHAGQGREFSGSDNDIHSHKWGITPRLKDGVYISSYNMQPEFLSSPGDMTIGVFCHELGHVFGLPDLYDIDYSSQGVGKFCLMSYGSWNGVNGSSPSYPSAWCRKELGFGSVVNVTTNRTNQDLEAIENGGSSFRVWSNGDTTGSEYFLLENRQKTGFDSGLPSSGLLIWHIDESKPTNASEWWDGQSPANHYKVALEQADGLWEMEQDISSGNAGDPFPGNTLNTSFSNITTPSSDSYESGATVVAITNISNSASTMTADLIVGIAAAVEDDELLLPSAIALAQNYPNPFNPETIISFSVEGGMAVTLEVYNIAGQLVKTLIDGVVETGVTTVSWDATDENGRRVASGIYLYRLLSASTSEVKKMVLVR